MIWRSWGEKLLNHPQLQVDILKVGQLMGRKVSLLVRIFEFDNANIIWTGVNNNTKFGIINFREEPTYDNLNL